MRTRSGTVSRFGVFAFRLLDAVAEHDGGRQEEGRADESGHPDGDESSQPGAGERLGAAGGGVGPSPKI